MAADHPLAERGTASLEELGDNHVVDFGPDVPEYWVTAMIPTRTPLGRRIPRGPAARTTRFSLVASGQCVHPLGEIAARYNSPPAIVFLPVREAPTIHYALTWRSTADSPTLRALAQTAADHGPISM
ncbi:LysR substrate-binding domain-containing protein [Streptomyces canus]|uniref:LysR substrate-binding domain-containing protein n=1 Tax=Streptomyces canus TaxID=58343 RepID=UPI0036D141EE